MEKKELSIITTNGRTYLGVIQDDKAGLKIIKALLVPSGVVNATTIKEYIEKETEKTLIPCVNLRGTVAVDDVPLDEDMQLQVEIMSLVMARAKERVDGVQAVSAFRTVLSGLGK